MNGPPRGFTWESEGQVGISEVLGKVVFERDKPGVWSMGLVRLLMPSELEERR